MILCEMPVPLPATSFLLRLENKIARRENCGKIRYFVSDFSALNARTNGSRSSPMDLACCSFLLFCMDLGAFLGA